MFFCGVINDAIDGRVIDFGIKMAVTKKKSNSKVVKSVNYVIINDSFGLFNIYLFNVYLLCVWHITEFCFALQIDFSVDASVLCSEDGALINTHILLPILFMITGKLKFMCK